MNFEKDINGASVRFTRLDTQKSVDVFYDASSDFTTSFYELFNAKMYSRKCNK
jgi:hypothetical protein